MTPDGFHIEHNAVSLEVWKTIQHWLSTNLLPASALPDDTKDIKSVLTSVPIPWETGPQMQNRRIAQFGNCKYDYIKDVAIECNESDAPIPRYIRETLLTQDESEEYTQCIINCYDPSNEIPWHLDHEYFGERVLVFTFGEDRPLLFRKSKLIHDNLDEERKETKESLEIPFGEQSN